LKAITPPIKPNKAPMHSIIANQDEKDVTVLAVPKFVIKSIIPRQSVANVHPRVKANISHRTYDPSNKKQ